MANEGIPVDPTKFAQQAAGLAVDVLMESTEKLSLYGIAELDPKLILNVFRNLAARPEALAMEPNARVRLFLQAQAWNLAAAGVAMFTSVEEMHAALDAAICDMARIAAEES